MSFLLPLLIALRVLYLGAEQEEFKEAYKSVYDGPLKDFDEHYDFVWSKIDTDNDGNLTVDELAKFYGFGTGEDGEAGEMTDEQILQALAVRLATAAPPHKRTVWHRCELPQTAPDASPSALSRCEYDACASTGRRAFRRWRRKWMRERPVRLRLPSRHQSRRSSLRRRTPPLRFSILTRS